MRAKIVASLVLIVLLPTALLVGLGQRVARNEQQVVAMQVRSLAQGQLAGIDGALQDYFRALQKDLRQQARQAEGTPEGWRTFGRASPQVRQVLVLEAEGKVAHPPLQGPWAQGEREFLQRVAAVVDNPALLTQGAALPEPDPRVASPAKGSFRKTANDPAASDAAPAEGGWYAWYWNAELRHIHWWREGRRVIGFELAPIVVMSDIVASLPATDPRAANALTRLVDGGGRVLYEWGPYRPQANERSLATWPLSHPLASWKLEYFAPPLQAGAAAGLLGVLAQVLPIALVLAGLAAYLYREHRREVREAQQRVDFVNQVSHELKTPLTNIRMYAELLQTELEDVADETGPSRPEGEKTNRYIAVIVTESQRLSRLIGNVLNFGRFENAEMRLHAEAAIVDDVIRRCLAAFQPALATRGIAVRFDAGADASVLLDAQALEQIVNNLVSNVEKYAAAGGALQIASSQAGGRSTIDVRDFGPGIADAERERVFQPFYRVSSLLTDGVAGTGIGLDIARRLARLHGGEVLLMDSERGAWFRVELATPPAEGGAKENA